MFAQVKQVGMTYITWRWMWLIAPFMLLMSLPGLLLENSSAVGTALGFPCVLGLILIVAITKWQFANPRARLMPGFREPHLLVFGTIVVLTLLVNPILFAVMKNTSVLGPLAFTLLLGSCSLLAFLLNRGVFAFVATILFCTGVVPGPAHTFWFGSAAEVTGIHLALALTGLGVVSYCLWFVTHLTEEMDEYQVIALGGTQVSRMERAEQRRLMGQLVKKQKLMGWLIDGWLDASLSRCKGRFSSSMLEEFGFARIPGYLSASLFGLVGLFYSVIMMYQFGLIGQGDSPQFQMHQHIMLIVFAVVMPSFGVASTLIVHRPRMAQELLRPMRRSDYFDRLGFAMIKRSVHLWCALHLTVWLSCYATNSFPPETSWPLVLQFLILSLAVQLLGHGLFLRLGIWKSIFGLIVGMYGVAALQMGVLWVWWHNHKDMSAAVFIAILLATMAGGWWLIAWSRRKWLEAELG